MITLTDADVLVDARPPAKPTCSRCGGEETQDLKVYGGIIRKMCIRCGNEVDRVRK